MWRPSPGFANPPSTPQQPGMAGGFQGFGLPPPQHHHIAGGHHAPLPGRQFAGQQQQYSNGVQLPSPMNTNGIMPPSYNHPQPNYGTGGMLPPPVPLHDIPQDITVRKAIEKTAEYCSKQPALESTVQANNANNRTFDFLFGGPGSLYYRWLKNARIAGCDIPAVLPVTDTQQERPTGSVPVQNSTPRHVSSSFSDVDDSVVEASEQQQPRSRWSVQPVNGQQFCAAAGGGGFRLKLHGTSNSSCNGSSSTNNNNNADDDDVEMNCMDLDDDVSRSEHFGNTSGFDSRVPNGTTATVMPSTGGMTSTVVPVQSPKPVNSLTNTAGSSSSSDSTSPLVDLYDGTGTTEYDLPSLVLQYREPRAPEPLPIALQKELQEVLVHVARSGQEGSSSSDTAIRKARQYIEVNAQTLDEARRVAVQMRMAFDSSTLVVNPSDNDTTQIQRFSEKLHMLYLIHDLLLSEASTNSTANLNNNSSIAGGTSGNTATGKLFIPAFKPYLVWCLRACFQAALIDDTTGQPLSAADAMPRLKKTVHTLKLWTQLSIVDSDEEDEMLAIARAPPSELAHLTTTITAASGGGQQQQQPMIMGRRTKSRFDQGAAPNATVPGAMPAMSPAAVALQQHMHQHFSSPTGPPSAFLNPVQMHMLGTQLMHMPGTEQAPCVIGVPAAIDPNLLTPEKVPVGLMATMLKQISKRGKNLQAAFVPYRPLDAAMTPQSLPPIEPPTDYLSERIADFYDELKDEDDRVDREEAKQRAELEKEMKRLANEAAKVSTAESGLKSQSDAPMPSDNRSPPHRPKRPESSSSGSSSTKRSGGVATSPSDEPYTASTKSRSARTRASSSGTKYASSTKNNSRSSSNGSGGATTGTNGEPSFSRSSRTSYEDGQQSSSAATNGTRHRSDRRHASRSPPRSARQSSAGGVKDSSATADCAVSWAQTEMGIREDGSLITPQTSGGGKSSDVGRAGLGAATGGSSTGDAFESYRRARSNRYHKSIAQASALR
eukprot:Lankesteria_metandrocarpae@DN6002_c0_g1_i1.p1